MDESLANEEREALGQSSGFYRNESKASSVVKAVGKAKSLKKKGPIIAVIVLVIGLMAAIILVPSVLIGTIKENLISALGFKGTIAILEKQAEYVVREKLALGEMPAGLYDDFLAQGIEVGQVTVAGDFVRTREYIADLDSEVAAEGEYQAHGTGELAVRFGGEIITADNFVAKVEADPVLYAAYSEALNISAKYYYSDAVNAVYQDMGLNRGAFNTWNVSGDAEKDTESFDKALAGAVDRESSRTVSGHYLDWVRECETDEDGNTTCWWETRDVDWSCTGGGSSWTCEKKIDGDSMTPNEITGDANTVARGIVNYVAANCRDDVNGLTAEQNAAQILNTLISADEPYRAASDFMALMEAIERAQVKGDGPVNQMMNILSTPTETSYINVNTGSATTQNLSILETPNFVAAISLSGDYSKEEANNFSRDRILKATNTTNKSSIENMPLSTSGKGSSGDGLVMSNRLYSCPGDDTDCPNNRSASLSNLRGVIDAVRIGMTEKNSELFGGVVGANRILEGGSFISNTITQQTIGAMPSDEAQVALYQQEVNEVLARQAAAERATKSPFDTSSPYTFMGSLVRKVAMAGLSSYNSDSLLSSVTGAVGNLFSASLKGITTSADGSEDAFTTMSGECLVASTTGASCDLYGSTHNTVYTGYMTKTAAEWESMVSASEVEEFAARAMKRDATVGIESYDVCTREVESTESGGLWGKVTGFFGKLADLVRKAVRVVTGAKELESGCSTEQKNDGIATGSKYVLHGGRVDDTAKLSGYALYSTVAGLLEDSETESTAQN